MKTFPVLLTVYSTHLLLLLLLLIMVVVVEVVGSGGGDGGSGGSLNPYGSIHQFLSYFLFRVLLSVTISLKSVYPLFHYFQFKI